METLIERFKKVSRELIVSEDPEKSLRDNAPLIRSLLAEAEGSKEEEVIKFSFFLREKLKNLKPIDSTDFITSFMYRIMDRK